MKTAAYLGIGIVLLAWAGSATATTRYVGGGGSPNYTKIQDAINAAEPLPNGGRIDVGVYGGTSQASLSPQ